MFDWFFLSAKGCRLAALGLHEKMRKGLSFLNRQLISCFKVVRNGRNTLQQRTVQCHPQDRRVIAAIMRTHTGNSKQTILQDDRHDNKHQTITTALLLLSRLSSQRSMGQQNSCSHLPSKTKQVKTRNPAASEPPTAPSHENKHKQSCQKLIIFTLTRQEEQCCI